MTDLEKAARQLVERIDRESCTPLDWPEYDAVCRALEQPVQDGPVAWMLEWTFNGEERGYRLYDDERHCIFDAENDGGVCRPLYTRPQAREWVGLTMDELESGAQLEKAKSGAALDLGMSFWAGARWAETKLREKNA